MTLRLPAGSHVSLTEAVSWMAFGMAMRGDALVKHVMPQLGTNQYVAQVEDLKAAVDALASAAHSGKIALEGIYLPGQSGGKPIGRNAVIEPERLRDYRQFDINVDGLRFGQGLAWMPDAKGRWVYTSNARADHFVSVIVKRSDLMRQFGPVAGRPVGTLKTGLPDLPQADLHKWWNGLTPQERQYSFPKLWEMCRRAHPNHRVSRDRIRHLDPGRKPGRKTNRP